MLGGGLFMMLYGCATIGEFKPTNSKFYEVYNELANRHIDRTRGKQLRSSQRKSLEMEQAPLWMD